MFTMSWEINYLSSLHTEAKLVKKWIVYYRLMGLAEIYRLKTQKIPYPLRENFK